ncbi:GIY-YIG nuclease family protein [Saccharospirillum impatiens]|uniref:GIY-YIG nuclease family protein n=1 Tax=Saccharospirillum impatiens TaxID=169438 RepID=UPI0006878B1F|nr:GIY-YIG nuclease family protein [Saccharospirillum impatiens]
MLDLAELNLPLSPGVYRFYNRDEVLLYVGKSINIAQRVRSHFQASHHQAKEARLVNQTTRITYTPTAGETGALLLENHQIKTLQPLYNRRLRKTRQLWTLQPQPIAGSDRVEVRIKALHAESAQPELYGLFASKAATLKQVRTLARQFQLCERVIGLESGSGRCFGHQIGQCLGACCGKEPLTQHTERLNRALASKQLKAWPWTCPLVIEEPSVIRPTTSDWHLISGWAYLGTVAHPDELEALAKAGAPASFDLDTYFILQKALKTPGSLLYKWQNQRLSPVR